MRRLPPVYPAYIYYNRPLEHLLRMVPLVSSMGCFTEERFPCNPDETGEHKLDFKFYGFEQKVDLAYVVDQMRRDNCRPATLRSLLAFWMFNPIGFWCGHEFGFWRITALGSPQSRGEGFPDEFPGINFGTLRLDNGEKSWHNDQQQVRVMWDGDWLFLATKQPRIK